ncbi:MAG: 50S ribosomal protein L9 [Bacteroidales bacterium]|jgi:large subunit ribosomal protein L9|nr:50S ribosomal protein L9 [Bacteroidales bacterium]MDI9575755.1 50S ribosomal protein L9 [Bacteroidota bacterium]MDD2594126.1 50S ribosomal protein L9 [Bacteroidales bacterium]MDD3755350.1 50S ribosomal protein L9 [Bacteroidales bacterium]MDY0401018.1 50S ribosomal protein L9 [Bacteroidales bacterium]
MALVEVILKEDVPKLGYKYDLVKVKAGYARNYLIPKGYALPATPSNKKMYQEIKKQRSAKEEKMLTDAQALADKLNEVKLTIKTKVAQNTGRIYGSVTTNMIADAILEQYNFEIDRKTISIPETHIKQAGTYKAKAHIYRDIYAEFEFEIVSDEPIAENTDVETSENEEK